MDQSISTRHTMMMRLLGILTLPASVGLLFWGTKAMSNGTAVSALTGAFLLASAGAIWGKVDNDYPVIADRDADPEEMKRKKVSDIKHVAIVSGLVGLFMGGLAGSAEEDMQNIKTLPELDPQTVLRIETVTAAHEYCTGGSQGNAIAVNYKGKEYRLQCPKAP